MIFKTDKSFSNSKFKLINFNNIVFLRKFLKKNTVRDLESIIKQNNFKKYKINNFRIKSAKTKTPYNVIKRKKYYDVLFYYGKSGDEILQSANIQK